MTPGGAVVKHEEDVYILQKRIKNWLFSQFIYLRQP